MSKKWKIIMNCMIVALMLSALAVHILNYVQPGLLNVGGGMVLAEAAQKAPDKQKDNLIATFAEIDKWLLPVLWTVLGFSSLYTVFLGVMLAKADGAEAREQAKKRIRNFLIGLIAVVVLIVIFKLVTSRFDVILDTLGYNDAPKK